MGMDAVTVWSDDGTEWIQIVPTEWDVRRPDAVEPHIEVRVRQFWLRCDEVTLWKEDLEQLAADLALLEQTLKGRVSLGDRAPEGQGFRLDLEIVDRPGHMLA